MKAVVDGASFTYNVRRVWYHPAAMRWLDDGLVARSDDPRDGEVANSVPDVAVVELAEGGPELTAQCELATDDDLKDLVGQPVGILGFPIKGTDSRWPVGAHQTALADFAISTVSKMTDLLNDEHAPPNKCQGVWCDVDHLGGGASGSPAFLGNARVVGVICKGTPEQLETGFGGSTFRIDCLRELLAFHNLPGARAADVARAKSRTDWGPDPRLDDMRRAVRLVKDADLLRRTERYQEASEKCSVALRLAPNYPGALLQRSKANLYRLGRQWQHIMAADRKGYAYAAYADSARCLEIYPEWNSAWLIHMQNLIYVGVLFPEKELFPGVIKKIDELLSDDWRNGPLTDDERGFGLNVRAQCHHLLGAMTLAKEEYDESIKLAPDEPQWYQNRAQYWEHMERRDLAELDRQAARRLRDNRKQKRD